ncbi:Calcium/calmodulin-dependent protein kinase kinase 1, partial [Kappamyces sp. JEL0680]
MSQFAASDVTGTASTKVHLWKSAFIRSISTANEVEKSPKTATAAFASEEIMDYEEFLALPPVKSGKAKALRRDKSKSHNILSVFGDKSKKSTSSANVFFSSVFSIFRQSSSKSDVENCFSSDSTLKESATTSRFRLSSNPIPGHEAVSSGAVAYLSSSAPSCPSLNCHYDMARNSTVSGMNAPPKSDSDISLEGILKELATTKPAKSLARPATIHIQVHQKAQSSNCSARDRSESLSISTQPPLMRGLSRSLSREFESKRYEMKRTEFGDHLRSHTRQIVETNRVYSRRDQGNTIISPTGEPEVSQGKVNQFHLFENIGVGAFGRVVRALDEITQEYYACKIISKSRLLKKFRFTPGDNEAKMMKIKQEVAVLKKVSDHPKIIRLCEVLDDSAEDNLYLFFELCEGPVMEIQVGQVAPSFSEDQARNYFRDVLLGLEFLHFKGIIHCDLKPENIFLRSDGTVQIGDFGISMILDDTSKDKIENQNTSPLFTSPSALNTDKPKIHGKAADIWALGVTLYCFVHGHCPFEDDDIVALYQKIETEKP